MMKAIMQGKFLSSNTQDFIEVKREPTAREHPSQFLSSNTQDFIEVDTHGMVHRHAEQFLSSNTQDFIEVACTRRMSARRTDS